jgi:serine protease DegQ
VVVSVAGRPIANTTELLPAVAALPPASRARIGVRRGAELLELEITVGERPSVGQR